MLVLVLPFSGRHSPRRLVRWNQGEIPKMTIQEINKHMNFSRIYAHDDDKPRNVASARSSRRLDKVPNQQKGTSRIGLAAKMVLYVSQLL